MHYLNLSSGLRRLIFDQLLRYWHFYIGAIICLVITHTIQSYVPFLAKELADFVAAGTDIQTWKFFALALGIIIFRTSSRLLFFTPARLLERNMRSGLMATLENANPFRYQNFSPGQIFQRMYQDTEQMRALVGFALLQVCNIVIAVIILVPKLVRFNEQLIIALTPMVIASVSFALIVSMTRKYHRMSMHLQGEVQNYIMETYAGKKTIKNYQAELSFIDLFKEHSLKELTNSLKAGIALSFSMPIIPLGVGLSLVWGGHLIKMQGLEVNSIILFSGFIFLFLEPLMFLSWIGVVFVSSYIAWVRIKELVVAFATESGEEKWLAEANSATNVGNDFCVQFWQEPLNLHITPVKWTVFIGKTGHGKTHILKQLIFLYTRQQRTLAYVAQSPYLFNDSIEKNIFLGRNATENDLQNAQELLELFQLTHLAGSFGQLLKLEVGEHGKKLSGGQAKRVCLIRSLLCESEILVWDDPFSSIDVILEKQIVAQLKKHKLLQGKTVLLSSHRISSAKISDELIYIDKFKGIAEAGTVSTLLQEGSTSKTYAYFKDQMV